MATHTHTHETPTYFTTRYPTKKMTWLILCFPLVTAQTPYAVIHGLCSPDDGHNDARNMLRQLLIINI